MSQIESETSHCLAPNLKVVTLNIWGIKFISKDVDVRIGHLIEALNKKDYDIVALQEVWSYQDYLRIKDNISKNYKYSHYFHSGLVGSGCCIFSRHLIQNVFYHNFSLNGYMHKFYHGDWFAGKLVGLAQISYHKLLLNVYTTHLHANYSKKFHLNELNDEYLAHRYAQLYELGQYINMTSKGVDFTLVMGDLNTREFEKGYKLLRAHSHLLDAYKERPSTLGEPLELGITCNAKSNVYSSNANPNDAARIDYILFKNQNELDVKCVDYRNCLGRIPNVNLNYSDHEGVYGEFQIKESHPGMTKQQMNDVIEPNIEFFSDAQSKIQKHANTIKSHQCFLAIIALLCVLFAFTFNELNFVVVFLKNLIFSFVFFYSSLSMIFVKTIEKKNLKRTLDSMNVSVNLLKSK